MSKERISIRLSDEQRLVLDEIKECFNTSYSVLIRAIIQNFLDQNGDSLDRIIGERKKGIADADN